MTAARSRARSAPASPCRVSPGHRGRPRAPAPVRISQPDEIRIGCRDVSSRIGVRARASAGRGVGERDSAGPVVIRPPIIARRRGGSPGARPTSRCGWRNSTPIRAVTDTLTGGLRAAAPPCSGPPANGAAPRDRRRVAAPDRARPRRVRRCHAQGSPIRCRPRRDAGSAAAGRAWRRAQGRAAREPEAGTVAGAVAAAVQARPTSRSGEDHRANCLYADNHYSD